MRIWNIYEGKGNVETYSHDSEVHLLLCCIENGLTYAGSGNVLPSRWLATLCGHSSWTVTLLGHGVKVNPFALKF